MSAADAIKKALKSLESREIKVGWVKGEEYPEGTSVATVAYWNEFGASRTLKNGNVVVIPARAPLRHASESLAKSVGRQFAHAVAAVREPGDVDRCLNQIGAVAAAHVKSTIASNLSPDNATSTIEGMIIGKNKDGSPKRAGSASKSNRKFGQGKGKNTPLRDTGQLMKSVTWEID